MNWKAKSQPNYSLIFSVVWLVTNLVLVVWWMIHGLKQVELSGLQVNEQVLRQQRMLLAEGSFLFLSILVGGCYLIFLLAKDRRRHEKMQFFFTTFTHDLKTSLARLRIQAEMLEEKPFANELAPLVQDIHQLDLQLENSLWMAQIDSQKFLMQKIPLTQFVESLRTEFPELQVAVNHDAYLNVDERAFRLVLRNLFQNSILHGKADLLHLNANSAKSGQIQLVVTDNGATSPNVDVGSLGHFLFHSKHQNSNGIGLFVSRVLIEKMHGQLSFETNPTFKNIISVPGEIA